MRLSVALSLIFLSSISHNVTSDHVVVVQIDTIISENRCDTVSSERCSGWWIFRSCSRYYSQNCYVVYRRGQIAKSICETGWADLPRCMTPICTTCAPGQVCTAPEKCECLTTGGTCTNVPCTAALTCYPGTCVRGTCSCPPTFTGTDCLQSSEIPNIKNCDITLTSGNNIVGRTSCAAYLNSPQTLWINSNGLSSIKLSSDVEFKSNFPFPDVSFVEKPVKYGIAEVSYSINGVLSPYTCSLFSNDNPQVFGNCLQDITISSLGLSIQHGSGFEILTNAKVGGYKIGSKATGVTYSSFPKTYFNGNSITRNASIKFDNNPPIHCLSDPTVDCPTFPIYLAEDITSNPLVQAEIQQWKDVDSGIIKYHVEVFMLQSGQKGLANVGSPVWSKDLEPNNYIFSFNLDKAGVYSIELTVFDQANNSAKARNIMIYTTGGNLKIDETKEITIDELQKKDKTSKIWWVTNADDLKRKYFTLSWADYFVSNSKFNNDWSLPVVPLDNGIDDLGSYKNCYGQRNISQFNGLKNGISNYKVSYYVDNKYGGTALSFSESQSYDSTRNKLRLNFTEEILDGGTLAIELSCTDVVGAQITEHLFIHVDTSLPKITNYTFLTNYPDIYSSSVDFQIEEKDSGIKEINFNLYDGVNKNSFKTGTVQPKLRDPPSKNSKAKRDTLEGECLQDDSTCYCANFGKCYDYVQTIEIDHCWFDRMKIENLELGVTVVNNAGVSSSEKIAKLSDIKELTCRPVPKLQPGHIAAIVVCVIILFIVLLLITILLVRIYLLKKPVPQMMNRAYNNMRGMVTRSRAEPVTTQNDLYVANDEEKPPVYRENNGYSSKDDYLYTDRQTDNKPTGLTKDNLNMKEVLSRGKLMVINRATYNDRHAKNIPVAVKSLKNGADSKEKEFMSRKADFLKNLKPHENIVKCIGTVPGPYGTMIVTEFCETLLTKWLSSVKHVTPEILDEMSIFALNISKGVEHLHKNEIVHKRLSAKNVLLVKQCNQYVAKLIGFGPTFDKKPSVPVKWLAPETLETINDSSPTYNAQTDVWSFGITLWEIYSKGKSPYPDVSSSDAMDAIIGGRKNKKPDDCPPIMFDDIMNKCWCAEPNERPSFSEISKRVNDFRLGEGLSLPGYYDTNKRGGGGDDDDDDHTYDAV